MSGGCVLCIILVVEVQTCEPSQVWPTCEVANNYWKQHPEEAPHIKQISPGLPIQSQDDRNLGGSKTEQVFNKWGVHLGVGESGSRGAWNNF